MAIANPFSMSNMYNVLRHLRFSKRTSCSGSGSGSIPPPDCNPRGYTRMDSLRDMMTSPVGVTQFEEIISKLNQRELLVMTSLLTKYNGYFTEIMVNKNGSKRVQKLLGISDDVDAFLCAAISRCFLKIMTGKYSSHVAVRAMLVFDEEKRKEMCEHTLRHALAIACDPNGCIALNEVITDLDDSYYRNQLLDFVVDNALCLSNDASGNVVVQKVLKLNDFCRTFHIASNLHGHCVDLSLKKYGSCIVENILEAGEKSMVSVVTELLSCEGDRLMRLPRSQFGSFVVAKALIVTEEKSRDDRFMGLVHKLMPFLELLRRSHGNNVANILESIS